MRVIRDLDCIFRMIVTFLLALAVLFGGLVLLCIYVGRKYEIRHHVGELDDDMDDSESRTLINKPIDESNSKENL